jgi:alpha-L-rhamnosidase
MQKEDADGRLVPGIHVYENPKKILGDKKIGMYKLPQFRKTVSLKKTVKRAFAYVSGLGHFDFFINGKKWATTSWMQGGPIMTNRCCTSRLM